ncbi:MAG: ribosome recycling factor [Clostridia bacterium]|nr:ribosome recycling factor [Clostridia bacterium]
MQLENYDEIMLNFEEGLTKKIDRLKYEYSIIRAGRANPKMLEKVVADYYGSMTPITQMANISVPEARMIVISPWDISTVKEINRAILASDIGVTPTDDGRVIRLVFPALTEEKRKEIVKDVKKLCEETKIGIRNERKDVLEIFKAAEKDKKLTKDELENANNEVQKLVDKYNETADSLSAQKEKEVMEV